jgi:hypothetical protein
VGRHVVTTVAVKTATTPALAKGQTVELTAAQETEAASSIRSTTARDATGEPVGVSN